MIFPTVLINVPTSKVCWTGESSIVASSLPCFIILVASHKSSAQYYGVAITLKHEMASMSCLEMSSRHLVWGRSQELVWNWEFMHLWFFCKLRQFATDEKKLTKQIKEQQENEMKICATRQKTAYKNNKTRFKKVNKTWKHTRASEWRSWKIAELLQENVGWRLAYNKTYNNHGLGSTGGVSS